MLRAIQKKMDDWVYPGAARNWDDIRFVDLVRRSTKSNSRILDFGAGRGKDAVFDFRDCAESIVGVDVDEGVLENPLVQEKYIVEPHGKLPFGNDEFDLIYCTNVLEHIEDPAVVFAEISRVLKPGGQFFAKTTNKNHYIAFASRLTPFRFHQWYNKKRGREKQDTFETVYQCNSATQLRAAIAGTDLATKQIDFWEGRPEYLRFSPITYLAGIAYEKVVNWTEWLGRYRAVMVVMLEKKPRL